MPMLRVTLGAWKAEEICIAARAGRNCAVTPATISLQPTDIAGICWHLSGSGDSEAYLGELEVRFMVGHVEMTGSCMMWCRVVVIWYDIVW